MFDGVYNLIHFLTIPMILAGVFKVSWLALDLGWKNSVKLEQRPGNAVPLMEILKVRASSILIKILLLRAIQLNWKNDTKCLRKKKDIFASCCQLNILLPHGLSAVPDKTKKVWTKSKEKFRHDNYFSSVASAVKISKLSNSGSAWSA